MATPRASRDLALADVIALQAAACERAGSHLYARILTIMRDDLERGGLVHEILDPWRENAMADAIPLRFLAAVHHIVLSGRAPRLGGYFPSVGGTMPVGGAQLAGCFLETIADNRSEIEASMSLGVQTNEVGRAAALVVGFHRVAAMFGLPLRTLEVGSSGGLLLRWDSYGYVHAAGTADEARWGGDGLVFEDCWSGRPSFVDDLTVVSRSGCDIAPIDPATDEGIARLRSFLWPDQTDRRARLDAAIEVARRVPARVDVADAAEWVEDQLATPTPGVSTVVHHSIVLQYLPRPTFRTMRAAIEAAGARATADAPLAWLRMEPGGEMSDVRLRTWPGGTPQGDDVVLADAGYHGPPVNLR